MVGDAGWEHYLDVMAPYDAVTSLSGLAADRIYLQFGSVDDVVTPTHAAEWVAAAPGGVTVDTYPGAGHALDATAVADRAAWLADRLGLDPIRPEALAEVGLPDRPSRIP